MNLVTRDEEIGSRIKDEIRSVFPKVVVNYGGEDINEVIICPLANPETIEKTISELSKLSMGSKNKQHKSLKKISPFLEEFTRFKNWNC